MREWPEGKVTFVFTDIVGSTPLVHALGDGFLDLLNAHCDILRTAWHQHGGVEVKTEGDSFFVAFASAADALRACRQAQDGLRNHPWGADGQAIHVRIGVHTGEATLVGNDYLGMGVIIASRVQAAAHGDQILLTRATLDAAGPLEEIGTLSLGTHGLKGAPEAVELLQLTADGLPLVFPPPATLRASRDNLPIPPTDMMGRGSELFELENLLMEGCRLVSLVGPGGVGKTRLALEVAHRLKAYRPGGVFIIEAAALGSDASMIGAVATTLGLQLQHGSEPVDQVAATISQPTLLLLDNLEHLVEAGAEVAELLSACAHVQVLATSRTRLKVRAERSLLIEPLPIPPAGSTLDEARDHAASALFLERGEAVGARFSNEADTERILGIVRALEGLPLALELAAARLQDRSLEEIAEGIGRSSEILADGDVDLPARQRSMRATIDWSMRMLTGPAKQVLYAASVFRGGAAVQMMSEILGREIEGDLQELAAAHLVRRVDEDRIGLLEPVRDAAETLADEVAELHAAHARSFASLVEAAWTGISSSDQRMWLERIAIEEPNIDVAVKRSDPDLGLRIAANAARAWGRSGRTLIGAEILAGALERAGSDAADRPKGCLSLGNLRRLLGQPHLAAPLLEEARLTASEPEIRTLATIMLAEVMRLRGDVAEAVKLLEEADANDPDPVARAMIRNNLGLALHTSDTQRALELLTSSANAFRELGDVTESVRASMNAATILHGTGRAAEAARVLEDAMLYRNSIPDPRLAASLSSTAGLVAYASGDMASAERFLREAVDAYVEVNDPRGAAYNLMNLSTVLHQDPTRIEEALDAAERAVEMRAQVGLANLLPEIAQTAANIALQLGQPARAIRHAIQDDPSTSPVGAHLLVLTAIAQTQLGNREGAEASLERALGCPGLDRIPSESLTLLKQAMGVDWPPRRTDAQE